MAWRCRFLAARRSQHGRVIAEKRLSEELSGAPDALVDFHTGQDSLPTVVPFFHQNSLARLLPFWKSHEFCPTGLCPFSAKPPLMAVMKASFAGPSGILPGLEPPSWSLRVHRRVSFNAVDAEKLKSKGNSYAVSYEKDWPGSASNNQAIR